LTKFSGKILLALLSIVFVYITYYLLNSALEYSRINLLSRVLFGNTLSLKIDMSETSVAFGDRITKVEGEAASPANIIDLLARYKTKNELNVELESAGATVNKTITRINNSNYFLFLLLLLLFGVIQFLWGCVVYLIRPGETRSKLFLFFSITLCMLYYSAVRQFTSGNVDIVFILAVIAAGFLNFLMGLYLTNQKTGKLMPAVIIISASAIIFAYCAGIIMNIEPYPFIFIYLFLYYLICSGYTLFRLTCGIVKNNYAFIKWRYAILIIVLFIGSAIPVLYILLSLFSELNFPVSIMSGLTLLSPLMAGNAFLRHNQYDFSGFKIFQIKDLKLTFYNFFVAVLCSVLIYSLLAISEQSYYRVLYTIAIVFMLIMLLNSYHFLLRRLKDYGFENKDKYAFSAQKIAEICSSSESIENKLENIYSEISGLSGATSIRLALFINAEDDYFSTLGRFIEVLTKETDIYFMININRGVILKYALSRDIALESRIIEFLEKRNFIFAIPVIENDGIKGALLVGEKNTDGFYSEDDMYYFQTVVSQISQVIESDRLYRDYKLKKQYEEELDNASYVQLRLFPKAAIKKDRGLDISFFYRPYLRVIGDYFDFFRIDEDRTAVVIGDVSGHGLSTAMVLSAVNSITHAILREDLEFNKTFLEINNFLNKSYRGIELITLFIGIFNRKTKAMEYINAGHGAPLLIRKHEKKITHIAGRSKILGADPDAEYRPSMISLAKNDELILYTDGVMEIYNEDTGSGLNEDNFIKIISDNIDKDIDGKIIEIEKNVKFHSKDIKDDITIIGVRVH
jgi:phosphoserine phosphatase RsbU/P